MEQKEFQVSEKVRTMLAERLQAIKQFNDKMNAEMALIIDGFQEGLGIEDIDKYNVSFSQDLSKIVFSPKTLSALKVEQEEEITENDNNENM